MPNERRSCVFRTGSALLISEIETGERRLDFLEFYALARALDIDPAILFASVTKDLLTHIDL